MSLSSPSVDGDRSMPDLGSRLDDPAVFAPPEGWATTRSWLRAQRERDLGGPLNPAEFVVLLEEGTSEHRVLFAIYEGELRAECDCGGWQYHGEWCAHVAALWWAWTRGQLVVVDIDTDRSYTHPPAWLARRGGAPFETEGDR
ncbi:MAG: SWIM zinc finger family protein [Halolamina sp.]